MFLTAEGEQCPSERDRTTPTERRQSLSRTFLGVWIILDLCCLCVEGTNWHQYHQRPRPKPGSIVLGHREIKVPQGSWVSLDPLHDLVTRVLPGDRCVVTVLHHDGVFNLGTLTPKKFPCAFERGQVRYTHFGSKVVTKDRVKLQVRYDTPTDSLVVPLTLTVEATKNIHNVVTLNAPLVVGDPDGISNTIDGKSLGIRFPVGSGGSISRCELTSLVQTGGFPRYGILLNDGADGQPMDCESFFKMSVRYKLQPSSASSWRDYIPMLVEVWDREGRIAQQEYFQITVRIRDGITNSPPRPSFLSMMMMEVDQFVMTAITTDMLAAEDVESHSDDLVFNMITPLAPGQGEVISTDDHSRPITSFCQRDVKDLKMAYRPPDGDSEQERVFHMELEVMDTDGATSDRFSFMIVVKPMNTLAPVVTRNTGQVLFKGQSRPLSSNLNLRISDEDNLSDVKISVLRGCQHGVLTVLGPPSGYPQPREFFTPAEIDGGVVVYAHDGSETFSDNILFRMTDGRHSVDFLFPVTIIAADDEAPVVSVNTGLVMHRKETKVMSSALLSATDIDSEDSALKFVLVAPFSNIGQVILTEPRPPADLTGWTFNSATQVYERIITEWFQRNLVEGKVSYRHIGPRFTSAVTDQLVFRCQDDNMPPNQSEDTVFLIQIEPIDDLAPETFPGSTLVLNVKEYELTPIWKTCLHFTDVDSDDRDLKYTIVNPPSLGQIVFTDHPGVGVTEFTQAQVNHLKVAYQPPDVDLGVTPRVVQFTFVVQDTAGNAAEGIFTINLLPLDNKPPIVSSIGVDLNISARNTYVFTRDVLDATDQDTSTDNITFIVTQTPQFGVLRCVGVDLSVGKHFTVADINRGVVIYIHGGNGLGIDVVKVDVSDGHHKVPVVIRINVVTSVVMSTLPAAPRKAEELHITTAVNKNGRIQITGDSWTHSDDIMVVTFLIDQPPHFGVIQMHGTPCERLTLRDIVDGEVTYTHTGGEVWPRERSDSFILTVVGPGIPRGDRVIQKVRVQVSIVPVDSSPPVLHIGSRIIVTEGEKQVVTVENIRVEDPDTNPDDVICSILVKPAFGYLEITSPGPGSEKSRAGIAVTLLQFQEVRLGNVVYAQSIHKGIEPVEDRITLQCSDGINLSEINILTVVIVPANDEEPRVFTREFVVMEGMSLTFDLPILNAVDLDIPGDVLEFQVLVPPKHGKIIQHLPTGTVTVVTFTLQQIRTGSTIVYEHDDSETRHDNFTVRLSDGKHVVDTNIIIAVIPVDDETPRLAINAGLEVEISESKLITNKILKATDLDSEDGTLIYIIRQEPEQGCLQYMFSKSHQSKGSSYIPASNFQTQYLHTHQFGVQFCLVSSQQMLVNITAGMNFTQSDVDSGLICYQHTGIGGVHDLIKFDITDGVNPLIDRYFYVTVRGLDTVFPVVVVNRGLTLREGGRALLTTDLLSTSDLNSPDERLTFILTRNPARGRLEITDWPGFAVTTFTQLQLADDINTGRICYILRDGVNSTGDVFRFTVQGNGGTRTTAWPFRLQWAWVSMESRLYVVQENSQFLQVVLRRRGHLGETSFVSDINDITAERGWDYQTTPPRQVQFNPGQSMATWRLRIHDDQVYEGTERFQLVLSEPVMTLIEQPSSVTVEILDPEDECVVFFVQSELRVEEDVGHAVIPVRRTGDLTNELMVLCYTQQESAVGTVARTVLSFSDYISRPEDRGSVLRFDSGESESECRVLIIDDSLYEGAETFTVTLGNAVGGRVQTVRNRTRVVILPHAADGPSVYLGQSQYSVDESCGHLEVTVWRSGTDLSHNASVMLRSRSTQPVSALGGSDYVGIGRGVDFPPGVTVVRVKVAILDDLGSPVMEGEESFQLVLSMPSKASLGRPSLATVIIDDTISDSPRVQFQEAELHVDEADGQAVAVVIRCGDLGHTSVVRCYTRQGSARVMMDYDERPDTDQSIITFRPGREQQCIVVLVDDSEYEKEEEFRLVLGLPISQSGVGLLLGDQRETLIRITDATDKSVIRFSETRYRVKEPAARGQVAVVTVAVRRHGDVSRVSVVRVHTKDGSAHSGQDYNPLSQELVFSVGQSERLVEVQVLHDEERETRETFTLHLTLDTRMVADTQVSRAVVFIEEEEGGGVRGVMFPAVPVVVSLLVYDDPPSLPTPAGPHPPTGYPLVCVTACDPKHPDYSRTSPLCVSEGINNTLTEYRWLLGPPGTPDGVASPPRELDAGTFLTSTTAMVLDAVYLQPGARVQCSARAVSSAGLVGLELVSPVVEVSKEEGLCPPHAPGTLGAEPFSAKIRYTGPDDPLEPNLIQLTVTMTHVDGMLPFISTRPLSNLALTLTHDPSRIGNHRCSNLQGAPAEGNATRLWLTSAGVAQDSAPSLGFYNSLNLEACVWSFSGYYSISQLLSDCGGTIGTEGQVLNAVQSYVTLRVPLFVSYVFYSPMATGGWLTFDLRSDLRMTFTYDTSILWHDGIGSPPDAPLQGSLYPTSMRINGEGCLVVTFKTEARFRGHFILTHPGTSCVLNVYVSVLSVVKSEDHPGLLLSLSLVRSETSLIHTVQTWSFVSQLAVRDYSGSYTITLLPCVILGGGHPDPAVCHPRSPLSYNLDVRFQQVSDPVPVEFSLNTVLVLLSKRELWLSDGSMGFGQDSDVAFSEGSVIYGRVMVDPVQSLGNSFHCYIQQVFLCTGADGYIPKYRPGDGEYGCLADAPSLLYRLKILDKSEPQSQAVEFGGIRFEAYLAGDMPGALPLVSQPDADGFSLSSAPLFQVSAGREWYVHAVYTVRSRDHSNRNYYSHSHAVGKRSLSVRHVFSSGGGGRQRRDSPVEEIGEDQDRGTNLQHVPLLRAPNLGQRQASGPLMETELRDRGGDPERSPEGEHSDGTEGYVTLGLVVLVVGCLGGLVVYIVFVSRERRELRGKNSEDHRSSSSSSTSTRREMSKRRRGDRTGEGGAIDSSEV
uniref:Calx-beta domain-containing protein n=1 Tax=Esox lucius TaxID=8010 RepID=A0AAY5KU18_ESOLU